MSTCSLDSRALIRPHVDSSTGPLQLGGQAHSLGRLPFFSPKGQPDRQAATGVPLATVSYWTRKAKGAPVANSATRPKARRGRPAGSRNRTATSTPKSSGIAWVLDGDVLVIHIPLRVFARQIAEEALRKI